MNITYIDQNITDATKTTIRLPNLYDTMLISNEEKDHIIRIPINDFFLKYHRELEESKVIYAIADEMFYKPKTVSLQLYGTTELWLALLRANNMKNTTEFHYPIIDVYEPNRLMDLIRVFFKREGKF